jgi:class 3 adenylate cyclase
VLAALPTLGGILKAHSPDLPGLPTPAHHESGILDRQKGSDAYLTAATAPTTDWRFSTERRERDYDREMPLPSPSGEDAIVAVCRLQKECSQVAETARVQCIFLDVVGFTKDRSVEAQSDVVATINEVVRRAIGALAILPESTILLPTGDGIAIALVDITGVDVHLQLALEILRLVAEHNSLATDPMRRFEIRVGINENVDNLVEDINGKRNVAGAGISVAQRVMDKADGGQILVGQSVYDVLRQREKYLSSFHTFTATGKHGVTFPVHQFVSEEAEGLNLSAPSAFAATRTGPTKLSKLAAYYLAHAVTNRKFLISRKGDATRDYAAVALLISLAEDSVEASRMSPHEEATPKTWRADDAGFEEQYQHYLDMDFWPPADLASLGADKHLSRWSDCFEKDSYCTNYAFVTPSGVERLQKDWPEIALEFGIRPPGYGSQ